MTEIDYEKMSDLEAKEFFDKNYNISYVDENLPAPSNELLFKHYVSSAFVYAIAVMFFLFNPFYINLFSPHSKIWSGVVILYFLYLIFAPVFLFTIRPKTVYASHSIEVMNYILKLVKRDGLSKNATAAEFLKWLTPAYKEKQSIILYFIKFFFAPQLLVWSVDHANSVWQKYNSFLNLNESALKYYTWQQIMDTPKVLLKYRSAVFGIMFSFLYFIDCFVYTIGYCTELTFLKNRIRSVESTACGLIFCLICYPNLSSITAALLPWNHNEIRFDSLTPSNPLSIIVWTAMLISVFLCIIYVSASIALATKASNLTNRGTVKIFPYNIVRHPAYSSKVIMWWVGTICTFKFLITEGRFGDLTGLLIGAAGWTFIYYMRAITEERHLSLDPEYRAYTKQVKYRFIPYIW